MNVLTIAYAGEGSTDKRFLGNIILRTFEDVLFDAVSEIEVYDPVFIKMQGENHVDKIYYAAQNAQNFHVLCVHADADADTDQRAFEERINLGFNRINEQNEGVCKNLVAVVPVRMTEAWMMADIDVLKDEIGTEKSNVELGLPTHIHQIESIAKPKDTIKEAIRLAFEDVPKRRSQIDIAEFYTPLSQKIRLEHLNQLKSYRKFKEAVRQSLINLNYLQRN